MHQLKDHPPAHQTPRPHTSQQVPPVSPASAAELTFSTPAGLILKLASLGDSARVSAPYATHHEHWYTPVTTVLRDVKALTMSYLDIGEVSNADLKAFFENLTQAFSAEGDVADIRWGTDVYKPPQGYTAYLFTAQDPDNSAHPIGLVLTLDGNGSLREAAWYKTSLQGAYSGFIWEPGKLVSGSTLEWTFVASGDRSNPPNPPRLEPLGGRVWYQIAEGPPTSMRADRARRKPTPAR
jgi:hypothetical protein